MNFQIKVYYEDTDSTGRVYHSNYLNFLERARTEYIYNLGYNHNELFKKHDLYFVVKKININFKSSAKFEDILNIKSKISEITRYKIIFNQKILRNEMLLIEAEVVIVSINSMGKLIKIPQEMINKLGI